MTHIVIATANTGRTQDERTLRDGSTLARVYMSLKHHADAERAARGNPAYPVTVRAWRVTDAGTHIFPPVAELTLGGVCEGGAKSGHPDGFCCCVESGCAHNY